MDLNLDTILAGTTATAAFLYAFSIAQSLLSERYSEKIYHLSQENMPLPLYAQELYKSSKKSSRMAGEDSFLRDKFKAYLNYELTEIPTFKSTYRYLFNNPEKRTLF